ncbi:MAG: helix-turn-helix domain-containing protein [Candidatus Odinarchaeota archaeon]
MESDFEDSEARRLEEFIHNLTNFELSKEEAKVYFSLLRRGTRGEVVGKIKNELEIGRTTIYAIMERLNQNGWIFSEEISESPKRIKYIAKPPMEVLGEIIKIKEKKIRDLKDKSLKIGDKLDILYQGAKKLSINTIHTGGYKYLKPLIEQGWKIKSEVVEHEESEGRLTLDYELKANKGMPKDCGLIIFFFDKEVENNKDLIKETFNIFKTKTKYEIQKDKIPGFEDVKLEDTRFGKYLGADIFIKLKFKKKWWFTGQQAVIPKKNKIFLIFGTKENFQFLLNIIEESESFHHLV